MISGPIVVGVDGSPESATAAAAGWRLADAAKVRSHLVHATSVLAEVVAATCIPGHASWSRWISPTPRSRTAARRWLS
jgi:hypothetical protein